MANIDGPKYLGPVTIDLSDVKESLIDLPPGGMRGIRAEQEGIDKVIAELANAMPNHGDEADVPPQAYQRFVQRTTLLAQLRVHETELEKALEIIRETRAKTANDREDDIALISKAVQDTAKRKKDPSVAAPFEQTIRYHGQIAEKAASTRKKNAEAKSGGAPNGGEAGGQAPPA